METITKGCTRCEIDKPLSEFSNAKATNDGKMYVCKQCNREINHEWRKTPSGIYTNIKSRQTHYKKHEHWRYKPVNMTRTEFIDWWTSQEPKCFYCGIHSNELSLVEDTQNTKATRMTVDCIENSKGYSLDNIVLACGRCNFIKNDFFTHDDMVIIGRDYVAPKWRKMLEQTITAEVNEAVEKEFSLTPSYNSLSETVKEGGEE